MDSLPSSSSSPWASAAGAPCCRFDALRRACARHAAAAAGAAGWALAALLTCVFAVGTCSSLLCFFLLLPFLGHWVCWSMLRVTNWGWILPRFQFRVGAVSACFLIEFGG